MGEALVFSALCTDDADRIAERFGEEVKAFLPDAGLSPASFFRSREDLLLWVGAGSARQRQVAVLGPAARERELERWIWWDEALGERGLERGLGQLLLQVLKLRYEHGVYRRRSAHLSDSEKQVERALGEFLAFLRTLQGRRPDRFPIEELLDAQDRLVQQQTRSGGLLFGMSKLRELRRTVLIAEQNMKALMPAHHPNSRSSLFAHDLAIAEVLRNQIEDDLEYAGALQERAREAQRLVGLRLQQVGEYHAREQKRLTLFQASLVGSLIAAVGAIGALSPAAELRSGLRWPIIALLGASVLALPHLIVNWPGRYGRLDYALTMLLGAAVLWLVVALLGLPFGLAVAFVVAGGVAAAVIAWLLEKVIAARERPWLRQDHELRWVRGLREAPIPFTSALRSRPRRPRPRM
jgi:hypothetical protein